MLAPSDAYVFAGLTAGAADVPARLLTLRDLLELERAPGFDVDAVLRAARRWAVEAALARAIVVLDDGVAARPATGAAAVGPVVQAAGARPVLHGLLHELGAQLPLHAGHARRCSTGGRTAVVWRGRCWSRSAPIDRHEAGHSADHVRRGISKLRR